MYNIVYCTEKKRIMFKSYLPGINTLILTKKNCENILSEKLVYELHAWIEISPSCNTYPQCKIIIIYQNIGTRVKEKKHLLQISARELHNNIILPISEGVFLVQEQFIETYVLEICHLGSKCQNILNQ